MFFYLQDLEDLYGITVGDYITTTGALNGANNVTLKRISQVERLDLGTYLVIEDVSFVAESNNSATAGFRSKYDTLPNGLKMSPDEVDVAEHELFRNLYLLSFVYDMYFKDTVDGKDFLEREIYLPCAAYSIPRKARSSVAYTINPIPGANLVTLNTSNVKNASKISLRRTFSKFFYNAIIYKFDKKVTLDEFQTSVLSVDATSLSEIKVGYKALEIQSNGMRTNQTGISLAQSAGTRKLSRYSQGAEHIENIEVLYGDGFAIEIGDTVMLDSDGLYISNSKEGDRSGFVRLFEVYNKETDLKSGNIRLSLIDTNFSTQNRYGLISPSSRIKTVISETQFVVESVFTSVYGTSEYKKWKKLNLPRVVITDHNANTFETTVINSDSNTFTVLDSVAASAGMYVEFATYDNCTDQQRLAYGYMTSGVFNDGASGYMMI